MLRIIAKTKSHKQLLASARDERNNCYLMATIREEIEEQRREGDERKEERQRGMREKRDDEGRREVIITYGDLKRNPNNISFVISRKKYKSSRMEISYYMQRAEE